MSNYDINALHGITRVWLRRSGVPVRFRGIGGEWHTENGTPYDRKISGWLKALSTGGNIKVEGGMGTTGVGLLLSGPPGLGKTTLACSILQDFIRAIPTDMKAGSLLLAVDPVAFGLRMRPGYYITYPALVTAIKDTFGPDAAPSPLSIDGIYGRSRTDADNVRLLVLDDLGKEHGTDFTNATFDELLRTRYDAGFPTIITTNVPLTKWAATYGEAMASFAHEAFLHVELAGSDRRSL